MPFYDLRPQNLVLRAKFCTEYEKSSDERKSNIILAARALNGTFVDVGGEFSFNRTVGERTISRGYKQSKIIVDGNFVDGVGGGVCQVSTTLYNALLLAGMKITEYHPHTLAVSYVPPSLDAMVNSGYADLKFINVTKNPVIIKATADDSRICVEIFGEPMKEKYFTQSEIIEEIPVETVVVADEKGDYPDIFFGERRIINYGKKGIKSRSFLIKQLNGKTVYRKKIRSDKYNCIKRVIIEGRTNPKSPRHAES